MARRLMIHDFAGHPYAPQLSRALAARGHHVVHAYCSGVATGQGAVQRRPEDPATLEFVDVSPEPFERYAPIGRLRCELRYGRRLAALVARTRPEVVLSANCPLGAQAQMWRAARRVGAQRTYWLQDFLGRGTRAVLASRSTALGATFGAGWEALEQALLRRSDHVVVITDAFLDELDRRGVTTPATVIPNWTPLEEVPPRPKDNAWSRSAGLADRPVAVYAGTLGLKHDPEHLVALAERLRPSGAAVLVATEGIGRDRLEARRTELGLDNLLLRDFLPWEDLPDLLGTADVTLVLLEPDAGTFSAPSKVLTYLAAGRPIVGAMPAENLASQTVLGAGAGEVVRPGDHEGFAGAVAGLLEQPERAAEMARAGRAYATEHFDVERVADRFLEIFDRGGRPDR
jgi:glycosyltransferase involved in cell wall biosynthesis